MPVGSWQNEKQRLLEQSYLMGHLEIEGNVLYMHSQDSGLKPHVAIEDLKFGCCGA